MKSRTLVLLVLAGVASGCASQAPSSSATTTEVVSASATPQVSAQPPATQAAALQGTVSERADASGYTYLLLKTASGPVWTAVPSNPVAVGTEVAITNPMPMQQFHSKTLNKTFDIIMFGAGVQPMAAGTPAQNALPPGHPALPGHPFAPNNMTIPKESEAKPIHVQPAQGPDAHTVAEVYRDRVALTDKTVSVRGQVVKSTGGILGHNWLHLRDGSGTPAKGDHDLVVTTTDDAKVNEEITVQGVVHRDKDLGSGYRFDVLIEDATLTH